MWKSLSQSGGIKNGVIIIIFKVNALVQAKVNTVGKLIFFSNLIKDMAIMAYLNMNL